MASTTFSSSAGQGSSALLSRLLGGPCIALCSAFPALHGFGAMVGMGFDHAHGFIPQRAPTRSTHSCQARLFALPCCAARSGRQLSGAADQGTVFSACSSSMSTGARQCCWPRCSRSRRCRCAMPCVGWAVRMHKLSHAGNSCPSMRRRSWCQRSCSDSTAWWRACSHDCSARSKGWATCSTASALRAGSLGHGAARMSREAEASSWAVAADHRPRPAHARAAPRRRERPARGSSRACPRSCSPDAARQRVLLQSRQGPQRQRIGGHGSRQGLALFLESLRQPQPASASQGVSASARTMLFPSAASGIPT